MARAGRSGWRTAAAALGVLSLGLGGGWVVLDSLDLAPGVLTLAPPVPPPAPYPSAPGALEADAAQAVLGGLDPDAPVPDAGVLTRLARDLVADRRLGGSTTVLVTDLLTGADLAAVDAEVGQVPASTAKVLTALAALTALGPDTTLDTTVVSPEPGQVVLVGGGDMMLAAGPGEPAEVVGHAGLADLAAQTAAALTAAGVAEVRVGVDDSLFTGPAVHPNWVPSDVAAGYVAAVTPVAVEIAKTDPDEPYPARYPDPTLHAAAVFADRLTEAGIQVVGDPTRAVAPAGATELARVSSAPMAQIVRHVLHVSENTIAEVLGRLVALDQGLPGSFAAAGTAVLAESGRAGLTLTGATLDDCSGLSAESRLPARVLVDAVELAAATPALRDLALDLPVAGWQGTLNDRLTTGPATGLVRAKTGSLPGVTSLAGTVTTEDGRMLVFAVLADATSGGQLGARAAIDEFVQDLAGCGCSG